MAARGPNQSRSAHSIAARSVPPAHHPSCRAVRVVQVTTGVWDVRVSLKLQATCTAGLGRGSGARQYFGRPVHAQAYAAREGGVGEESAREGGGAARHRRVLLVNKEPRSHAVRLDGVAPSAAGTLHAVDATSMGGAVSSASGIRVSKWAAAGAPRVTLQPFAVAVLVLEDER